MILSNLDTLLFTPTVSGGALSLNVSANGSLPTNVAVGDPEDVQVNISVSAIDSVRVKVYDNGGYLMYVTPTNPSGSTWARNEVATPKYSTASISVPEREDTSNEVTVTIEARTAPGATPTATRSQKLIIRRIPPTK